MTLKIYMQSVFKEENALYSYVALCFKIFKNFYLFFVADCLDSFVGFEDTFLRGVKEENFITYDTGTFDECLKHCCLEKM